MIPAWRAGSGEAVASGTTPVMGDVSWGKKVNFLVLRLRTEGRGLGVGDLRGGPPSDGGGDVLGVDDDLLVELGACVCEASRHIGWSGLIGSCVVLCLVSDVFAITLCRLCCTAYQGRKPMSSNAQRPPSTRANPLSGPSQSIAPSQEGP